MGAKGSKGENEAWKVLFYEAKSRFERNFSSTLLHKLLFFGNIKYPSAKNIIPSYFWDILGLKKWKYVISKINTKGSNAVCDGSFYCFYYLDINEMNDFAKRSIDVINHRQYLMHF